MLGAPQAKILWSAPSKSRFYYLFWLLELMPGHLRRSILRILVLNPTHEISWSRSGFFSLRGRILRAGPPGPLCFLVFVFSPPPSALEALGHPLNERLKTLRPAAVPRRAAASQEVPRSRPFGPIAHASMIFCLFGGRWLASSCPVGYHVRSSARQPELGSVLTFRPYRTGGWGCEGPPSRPGLLATPR